MIAATVGEFYQFVSAGVYHADGLWGDATCDLYLRRLPADHGYAVVAGIQDAIDSALNPWFAPETLEWLQALPQFSKIPPTFFDSLAHAGFAGDIWAMPEGSIAFPGEPVLRITAPLPQVALLETTLLQKVGFATGVATRAARLVDAAGGRDVLDFSARRWSGPEAAQVAARAAYIGGITGTSTVDAARTFDIDAAAALSGSLLAAYRSEQVALEALHLYFPGSPQMLLPGEDPLRAVARIPKNNAPSALRIGQPGLAELARTCRRLMDERGLDGVRILGSGGLDEHVIAEMVQKKVPVDAFGVGRALASGVAATAGEMSFRLADLMRGPTLEEVAGRWAAPLPGAKQVIRYPHKDVICRATEEPMFSRAGGVPLLHQAVSGGEQVGMSTPLVVARGIRAAGVAILPPKVRRLSNPAPYPVEASDGLKARLEDLSRAPTARRR